MSDPNMEGVERRLRETHDTIEVKDTSTERAQSAVADVEGIEAVLTPPRALVEMLDKKQGFLCDQSYQIVWPSGPWKGMPITGYCVAPMCATEGVCTGTKFVPHIDQWTSTDPALRTRRTPVPKEIVAAVRSMAKRAAAQTGRDEDRTDREILDLVKVVWRKTIEQIKGKGGEWRR